MERKGLFLISMLALGMVLNTLSASSSPNGNDSQVSPWLSYHSYPEHRSPEDGGIGSKIWRGIGARLVPIRLAGRIWRS